MSRANDRNLSKETGTSAIALESQQKDGSEDLSKEATSKGKTLDRSFINPEDIAILDKYLTTDVRSQILKLYEMVMQKPNARPSSFGSVNTNPVTDRQIRTQIHQVNIKINHSC